ncbi:ABC transporter substrate-binding protein [Novosphingobium bradum]|uniref:ABC transporter substrate-binding protein n=1 Tax=Novosphingobium bradum TaxID=1737444 RepID=A0ABV7IX04_9SPHN
MRTLRVAFRACLAAGLCAILAACADNSGPSVDIDVIGTPADPFEGGVRLSVAGQLVRAATAEGLVGLDAQGQVIPALADRWIVTDDGLSYIFRLRDGTWPDGTAITGESARVALRTALAGLAGTGLALDLVPIAEVRAMAGRVVELRLSRPAPDLLQLLAQPELGLLHEGAGGGPMALRREGAVALLAPIPPDRLGLPQSEDWSAGQRSLRLQALPAHLATARFAEGKVDIVLGGRFENLPLGQAVAGIARRPLRLDPAPGLFGLAVVTARGWLALPECREAMAMAIDRDGLGAALGLSAWTGTTLVVPPPPGSPPGERWADRTLAQRRAEAATRMARCKSGSGDPGPLRLALPDGPGADALHARLAQDLAAVGVSLARVPPRAAGDLRLVDAVARYARPEWYLHQLGCATQRGQCSTAADARLAEAGAASDPARAAQSLAEATAALTAANVYIPLGTPIRWSLARDRVDGFMPNAAAFHPLPEMARRRL